LARRDYRALPLRRHCIPKKNGKQRALGIPTMRDRAQQALYSYALAPVAATLADPNSYGFRPFRSCRDAIQQCFIVFARKGGACWVLDADIKACFDRISHSWLLDHIPLDRRILRQWLQCGFLDHGNWFPTEKGTPQGGVISPLLANMTLDGLEQVVRASCPARSKVNFIRYADDFIVTAATRELLAQHVQPALEAFLATRGLRLSTAKARIVHLADGFDFLGQTVRRFGRTLLIQPSSSNVQSFLDKIRALIRAHRGQSARELVQALTSRIRGWANYHRHVSARRTFESVDRQIGSMLRRWCWRRHREKPRSWAEVRYFPRGSARRVFTAPARRGPPRTAPLPLLHAVDVSLCRYIKVQAAATPFDPAFVRYFQMRTRASNVYGPHATLRERLAPAAAGGRTDAGPTPD